MVHRAHRKIKYIKTNAYDFIPLGPRLIGELLRKPTVRNGGLAKPARTGQPNDGFKAVRVLIRISAHGRSLTDGG